ncbi:bifunctional 4-hydroxy-2-oxoglutarate aldolase/2-dehydro-3-deoxy-phosphogluconate aldolase [Geobacillus thermoleovorans]|uniref:bifunctional 4-hydroxy-2-oxoglutarate aldolase/2-dehydro-3-deoxy-phosphogluconate aldolase n=1 Tax=Geobacillus thermoleovorans TaxID=33941 RepID=UPI000846077A|nr:bifunctional 4-hydroxy-2-oxoglutarate aldolase/2-dehydro-3-deoxy-phosphogluconate aldolase [Geobacillus thermoleovorans]AOL34682.1 2-dehydro-3-deoxyphosphogluconate aldolase [Geobacillus thermoleovorans]
MDVVQIIREVGVIPVVRGATTDTILLLGLALQRGGIPIIEITMETPGALAALEKATTELEGVLIGAGTVLDAETARRAIAAGARFIVSPSLSIDVIQVAKQNRVVSIAGGLTPTEIVNAFQHGADMVKVFPAHVFGPNYIRSIKEPLPHIPLIATGGINLKTAGEYIKAGVDAIGVGNSLVKVEGALENDQWKIIAERAAQWISIVHKERGENVE